MVQKFPRSSHIGNDLVPSPVLVCSIWIPWSRPSSSCRDHNPALAEQKALSQEAFRPISLHLSACQQALSNHSTLLARLPRSAEAVLMQWERAEGCPPCFNKHWHYTQVFSKPCIHRGKFAFYTFTFCLANLLMMYKKSNGFILRGRRWENPIPTTQSWILTGTGLNSNVCLCCFYNPLLNCECTQDKNGLLYFLSAITSIKQGDSSGVGQDSQNGRPCVCKGKPRLQNGLHYKHCCKQTTVYCWSCLLF